jgi:meso-butanediol dehydrogenase / (S,S)-butanediol dehydrogenase / diacetyl reductase
MASAALVVGGGTGIGAAVARRLARDGYSVCGSGRRPGPVSALAAELGGIAVSADCSSEEGAAQSVERCVDRYGRLDALVFSAGASAGARVGEQTLERWNRVIATNLTGAFLACRAALPALLDSRGSIVTVSSLAGLRAGPASAAYCSSKAGLIMLTQSLAVDYGPLGVRANCVCPGWVRTDMGGAAMEGLRGAGLDAAGLDAAYEVAVAHVPVRRVAAPEEVAEAVSWLASRAASYVNGAVLSVDGGAAAVDVGTLAFGATNERRD